MAQPDDVLEGLEDTSTSASTSCSPRASSASSDSSFRPRQQWTPARKRKRKRKRSGAGAVEEAAAAPKRARRKGPEPGLLPPPVVVSAAVPAPVRLRRPNLPDEMRSLGVVAVQEESQALPWMVELHGNYAEMSDGVLQAVMDLQCMGSGDNLDSAVELADRCGEYCVLGDQRGKAGRAPFVERLEMVNGLLDALHNYRYGGGRLAGWPGIHVFAGPPGLWPSRRDPSWLLAVLTRKS